MCSLKTGDIVGQAMYICVIPRVVRHWIRLPQEAENAPSMEVFKVTWGFKPPSLVEDVPAQSQEVRNR